MNTQSPLFPEITPFKTEMLPVTDGHILRVAQFGNPSGIPVVVLHGGPGSGFSEKSPRRFDPACTVSFASTNAGQGSPHHRAH